MCGEYFGRAPTLRFGSAHSGLRFARCFARFAPPCASRKHSLPEGKTHKSWYRQPRKPTNPAHPKISLIRDSDNCVRCMEGPKGCVAPSEAKPRMHRPERSEGHAQIKKIMLILKIRLIRLIRGSDKKKRSPL